MYIFEQLRVPLHLSKQCTYITLIFMIVVKVQPFVKSKNTLNNEQLQQDIVLIQNSISSKRATLLDFHASDISEQLTLIDSELFRKIQLSEILYMSIEKGEEYSPNLAAFTEHFNNISYW